MKTIVGIRFKEGGKVYYFDPNGHKFDTGSYCVVETSRGMECGEVCLSNRELPDEQVTSPLKKVTRPADAIDIRRMKDNREREKKAFQICEERIKKLKLEMSLVDVEYTFDRNKILFYFTADGRIDFRELVKELAAVFKTRIELRQIGVRDESKMMGGLGVCGRPFCCHSFMSDFHPVSIKMAKEQGLSLNPVKISGTCGRLMCCLNYEQSTYEEYWKHTPRAGTLVKTPEGTGVVSDVNVLKGELQVKFISDETAVFKTFRVKEVVPLRSAKENREKMKNSEKR